MSHTFTPAELELWMRRAYRISDRAVDAGNHPFGALVLVNSEILVEAENTVNTDSDPTRHAEMNAIAEATKRLGGPDLQLATLVTSTEPCPMCAGAIYWSGIKTVIFGCSASELERIAGPSLRCRSHDVFEGAIAPPSLIGPILENVGIAQHEAYWQRSIES